MIPSLISMVWPPRTVPSGNSTAASVMIRSGICFPSVFMSDGPRDLQHHMGDQRRTHERAGHDKDAHEDHFPSLLQEGLDLVADGNAGVGAYHGERSCEIDL